MSHVEMVVLSDLHLGAGYSLLTAATPDGTATPLGRSDTLRTLAAGLRELIPLLGDGPPPRLVLLGDVFELSFATPQQAGEAFETFVDALWADSQVFADEIVYVPGNHDHRMWRMIRDAVFTDAVRDHPGAPLPSDVVVTGLDRSSHVDAGVVTAIARRVRPDLTVTAGYPNIGLSSGGDVVVLHHGHYTEGTYRLMSKVAQVLDGRPAPSDLRSLELLNGPWIDFAWSESGDQSVIGRGLFGRYEELQDPAATHALVQRLAGQLIKAAGAHLPVAPETTIEAAGFSVTVRGLVEGLLDIVLDRGTANERNSGRSVLSTESREGVRDYLARTVLDQLRDEGWADDLVRADATAGRLSFVFGHTHKPFQSELVVPGFARPVQLWNTGGWVVDHPGLSPAQGAAAIVVDSDANVASLRLFNDPLNGSMAPVRAEGCHAPSDRTNPLLSALERAVERTGPAWDEFSTCVQAELDERTALLRSRGFDPSAHPPRLVRGRAVR